jgi:Arc/MetJ-type ribon-helix-helix transcriptional regulator
MWIEKLQIAIIEKDTDGIDELVSNMPDFTTLDEVKSASSLIKEALKLLKELKKDTGDTLAKLKKHKDFLYVTQQQTNKFDVVS